MRRFVAISVTGEPPQATAFLDGRLVPRRDNGADVPKHRHPPYGRRDMPRAMHFSRQQAPPGSGHSKLPPARALRIDLLRFMIYENLTRDPHGIGSGSPSRSASRLGGLADTTVPVADGRAVSVLLVRATGGSGASWNTGCGTASLHAHCVAVSPHNTCATSDGWMAAGIRLDFDPALGLEVTLPLLLDVDFSETADFARDNTLDWTFFLRTLRLMK